MISKNGLGLALKRASKAYNLYLYWLAVINEYSLDKYGVEPGDIDCDEFIDSVCGGCGINTGMTADEFIKAMDAAMELHNEKP